MASVSREARPTAGTLCDGAERAEVGPVGGVGVELVFEPERHVVRGAVHHGRPLGRQVPGRRPRGTGEPDGLTELPQRGPQALRVVRRADPGETSGPRIGIVEQLRDRRLVHHGGAHQVGCLVTRSSVTIAPELLLNTNAGLPWARISAAASSTSTVIRSASS